MSIHEAQDITDIEFGIYSAEEIKSMAVCKIDKTGLTGPGTVYDKSMGCVDGSEECITCKQKKDCWGHFGYIELNEPILHPMFYKTIVDFLKCFCKHCYRLLILNDQIILDGFSKLKGKRRFVKILEKLEKIDICAHCSFPQPKIVFKAKDNTILKEHKQKKGEGAQKISIVMNTEDIKDIFENICDEDIVSLGFNPERMRPINLIMTTVPVIPPCSRPFIMTEGNICDDDLTYQLLEIIKLNNQLSSDEENKKVLTEQKKQQVIQSLIFRISTMFNNTRGQAKHPTDSRPFMCIKKRLVGKHGRLRFNLMGKRVNFSGRTVIGADPTLGTGQIGVPKDMIKILTKPEIVNKFNIKELEQIVNDGKANFIIKSNKDGGTTKINLKYGMFRKGTELLYGDTIVRGNVQLNEIDGFVTIPAPTKGIEVINVISASVHPVKKGDRIIRKNKVTVISKNMDTKLKTGDVIIRGDVELEKDENGNYIIPKASDPITIINITTGNETLQDGDQLIRNGKLVDIQYPSRKNINLQHGDIVERHLRQGDIVLFNRQPTLWKGGMMAMEVVPGNHKTLRFNLAAAKSFNADFDGDEMNIHAPQSYDAEAELRYLSAVKHNMISAQESKPSIIIVQDSLIASYLMTRKNFILTRSQFTEIANKGKRPDGSPLWNPNKIKTIQEVLKKHGKNPEVFNGKGLFSLLFPDDLFYEVKNNANPEEPIVKIYSGVLVEGTLNKTILGPSHNSLLLILHKEYGVKIAVNFIDNIQFLASAWLLIHGFSVGLEDCMITSEESNLAIKDTLIQCYTKAQGIEENTQNPGIREVRVTAALSQAKDIGMRIAQKAMKPDNNFLVTVGSGAKGDFFNIAQITGLLGQQNLEGQRVTPMLNHGKRTLPHYPFDNLTKEKDYESRGFIRNSFIHGLTPEEFYFHAMSGREGVSDTAMGTAKSGYIQRRIIKACEDIQVKYDHTVRDTTNRIYQFAYGENNFDPTRTVRVNGEPQACDIERLANKLNFNYEQNPETFNIEPNLENIMPKIIKHERNENRKVNSDDEDLEDIIEDIEKVDPIIKDDEKVEDDEDEDDDEDDISSLGEEDNFSD